MLRLHRIRGGEGGGWTPSVATGVTAHTSQQAPILSIWPTIGSPYTQILNIWLTTGSPYIQILNIWPTTGSPYTQILSIWPTAGSP